MKKYLVVLLCLVAGINGAVSAQTTDSSTPTPPQPGMRKTVSPTKRAARQLGVLQEKLNLDPGQVQRMNIILLNQKTTMDSLNANNSGNKRTDWKSRRKLMQGTDRQIAALLNEDQKKLYREWKTEQKEQHRDRGRRGSATAPAQE
jgi:hypothetical protein